MARAVKTIAAHAILLVPIIRARHRDKRAREGLVKRRVEHRHLRRIGKHLLRRADAGKVRGIVQGREIVATRDRPRGRRRRAARCAKTPRAPCTTRWPTATTCRLDGRMPIISCRAVTRSAPGNGFLARSSPAFQLISASGEPRRSAIPDRISVSRRTPINANFTDELPQFTTSTEGRGPTVLLASGAPTGGSREGGTDMSPKEPTSSAKLSA